jgi:hypothetical protein
VTVDSSHTCIIDNTFIGSYGSDSDSLKSFNDSGPHVIVRGNDFHTGYEQAIDATAARGWLIDDNDFHDAPERGIGFKFGASGNIVRNNRFTNLGAHAISLGGGSSPHIFPFEAENLLVEGNRATNLGGSFVGLFACRGCAVVDNVVDGAAFGVHLFNDDDPSGCPGGCPISARVELTGNRFRRLTGGLVPDVDSEIPLPANLFVLAAPPTIEDFTAGENLYCSESGDALFVLGYEALEFAAWTAAVMSDSTSTVAPSSSPSCQGW